VAAGTGHCAQGPVALAGVATITYSGSLMGPPVIAAEVARGVALSLTEAALPHAVAASWQHVRMADFRAALRTLPCRCGCCMACSTTSVRSNTGVCWRGKSPARNWRSGAAAGQSGLDRVDIGVRRDL
jgi:hypothetical protein